MAVVTFKNAARIYPGSDHPSADALNLEIADGEFLVLVGPSGCGKSTSLCMLAGLEDVNTGRIFIGGRDITGVQPRDRDTAMVFRNYALYPHMTVYDNMGFAFKIVGTPKAEIDKHVREATKILDPTKYLGREPKALSGGQRQRAVMGRAIVRKPKIFLTDEPLSNLDTKPRAQTRTQIVSLQYSLGVATVYVTHNQTEAFAMGDRIAVLKDGVLQQVGAPHEMYDHFVSDLVVGFIGSPTMNLGQFTVKGDVATIGIAKTQLSKATLDVIAPEGGGKVTIGSRSESLDVVFAQDGHSIPVRLSFVEKLGPDTYIYGELTGTEESEVRLGSGEDSSQIIVRVPSHTVLEPGETVYTWIRPGQEHIFSVSTGKCLSA